MPDYNHERENGERYAAELDAAAEILQRVHPIGKVKGIGRLEVVAALEELFDWHPADSAPFNKAVLAFVPHLEHYGPGIYRAIRVNMGTGIRWQSNCWAMGRDFTADTQPTHWCPLPEPPKENK
jgi:hypothetical protein